MANKNKAGSKQYSKRQTQQPRPTNIAALGVGGASLLGIATMGVVGNMEANRRKVEASDRLNKKLDKQFIAKVKKSIKPDIVVK